MNRLANSKSPYLRAHASNPVDWYPWSPEAIKKAQDLDRPIFLSVGYSTCHWCHVMAEESFESTEVAQVLNDHFISIKVDREERPDLDETYMEAVMLFTGGRGGWPVSVFLTPSLEPFFGGTYFPKEAFLALLCRISELWKTQRERLLATAKEVMDYIRKAEFRGTLAPTQEVAKGNLLKDAEAKILSRFDQKFGGFIGAPKFPPHQALRFLIERLRDGASSCSLVAETVRRTLDRMAHGGLFDHVGGGFHRYAVDERWEIPHFEKMLYDNAQLALVYSLAYTVLGIEEYAEVAHRTYDFMLRELRSHKGAFFSALDADSPVPDKPRRREEGAFYLWTPEEVSKVLGDEEAKVFCMIFGICEAPNFLNPHTGYRGGLPNLLGGSLEEWAMRFGIEEEEFKKRVQGMVERMRAAREKRPRPKADEKIICAWNGLAIESLCVGAVALRRNDLLDAAVEAASFILEKLRADGGRLLRSYYQGQGEVAGMLDDYAYLLVGLLELYEGRKEAKWLDWAEEVATAMVRDFWDEGQGTFFYTDGRDRTVLVRMSKIFDGAEPSPTGMAALGLVRLGRIAGRPDYLIAERTLRTCLWAAAQSPWASATILLAMEELEKVWGGKGGFGEQWMPYVKIDVEPSVLLLDLEKRGRLRVEGRVEGRWRFEGEDSVGWECFGGPVKVVGGHVLTSQKEGSSKFVLEVEVLGVETGQGDLEIRLSVRVCDDHRCLGPQRLKVIVPVKVRGVEERGQEEG